MMQLSCQENRLELYKRNMFWETVLAMYLPEKLRLGVVTLKILQIKKKHRDGTDKMTQLVSSKLREFSRDKKFRVDAHQKLHV